MGALQGPTFLVVGAGKAGTTSLYSALAAHPDVFGARPKEVRYFSNFWKNGSDWYLEHFVEGQGYRHRFEASPQYSFCTEFPNVAKRIFEFDPEMQILYIVRDPIARIVSHFAHWNRTMPERYTDIMDVLTDRDLRRPFVERTKYWMQIEPYIELFGSAQVKCITLEDMAADYVATVNDVFKFLQIEECCDQVAPISNKSPTQTIEQGHAKLQDQLLGELSRELQADVDQILRFAGKPPDFWSQV